MSKLLFILTEAGVWMEWWKAIGWIHRQRNIICQHHLHLKSFQKKKKKNIELSYTDVSLFTTFDTMDRSIRWVFLIGALTLRGQVGWIYADLWLFILSSFLLGWSERQNPSQYIKHWIILLTMTILRYLPLHWMHVLVFYKSQTIGRNLQIFAHWWALMEKSCWLCVGVFQPSVVITLSILLKRLHLPQQRFLKKEWIGHLRRQKKKFKRGRLFGRWIVQ